MTAQRRTLWPIGLTVFIVLFIAATVGLVLFASGEHMDLVTDRAYEKGIAYQKQIEVLERTKALEQRPSVRWAGGTCVIAFPDSAHAADASGTLTFFRPDDASRDFSVPLALDANGLQRVPFGPGKSGRWNIGIAWKHAGLEYFFEEAVVAR